MAKSIPYYNATVEGGELKLGKPKFIDPTRCPHFILVGEHYRDDGSCKCDDPNETIMKEWGYRWNKKAKVWK